MGRRREVMVSSVGKNILSDIERNQLCENGKWIFVSTRLFEFLFSSKSYSFREMKASFLENCC